jgi:hypothetical protein
MILGRCDGRWCDGPRLGLGLGGCIIKQFGKPAMAGGEGGEPDGGGRQAGARQLVGDGEGTEQSEIEAGGIRCRRETRRQYGRSIASLLRQAPQQHALLVPNDGGARFEAHQKRRRLPHRSGSSGRRWRGRRKLRPRRLVRRFKLGPDLKLIGGG